MKEKLLTIFFLLSTFYIYSQSGIINDYSKVTDISGANISVETPDFFEIGDNVLLIQMTGITGFGNSGGTDNYAGNYELGEIINKSGNEITLKNNPVRNYTFSTEKVQLVRVPRYNNATIGSTNMILAKSWDSVTGTGGVLSLIDCGILQVTTDGIISANAKGFLGGKSINPVCNSYAYIKAEGTDDIYYGSSTVALSGGTGGGFGGPSSNGPIGGGGAGVDGDGGNGVDGDCSSTGHSPGGGGGGGLGGGGGASWDDGANSTKRNGSDAASTGTFNDLNKTLMGGGGFVEPDNGINIDRSINAGGGIIIIFAKTLQVDGKILAKGGDGFGSGKNHGGGGGGQIIIRTDEISGTGEINVNGGDGKEGGEPSAGGGGGGIWCNLVIPSSINQFFNGGIGYQSPGGPNGYAGGDGGKGVSVTSNQMSEFPELTPDCQPIPPLSLILNNFTAKNNDNKSVVLNWSSTNESNFNKFIIEKSNNTIDFNPIGEIKTITNNSLTKNYNYIDYNPFIGKNYYRLKMVDNDNSIKLSNISVVNILNQNLKLEKIKPNPFENQISIDFNIPNNDQILLEIIDITGKKIIQNQYDVISGDNNIQLNTNDLNKGIYILKISNSNITLKSKIIKN